MDIIERLLQSSEPAVRAKTMTGVLGLAADDPDVLRAREAVRQSPLVSRMLSFRDGQGRMPGHPYSKFCGAHWTLAYLADIEYPAGDERLHPMRDQALDLWLSADYTTERIVKSESARYKSAPGVPIIDGRARRCASQHGNALYSVLKLGIDDGRADALAELLIKWQWPDGGWNCDRRNGAKNSSFMESLIPMRALALHGRLRGNQNSLNAARRAAEIFLKRHLYRRQSDNSVMDPAFLKLRYPCYWHYDILFGLKVMAEAGFAREERCKDAVAVLKSKRLADGGFAAEGKHYKVVDAAENGGSYVAWGAATGRVMNEFVTADALYVLRNVGE